MASSRVLIQAQTLGSNQSSVIFSNIPNTYTDLVLKISVRTSRNQTFDYISVKLNSDTGNTYSSTELYGDSSLARSLRYSAQYPLYWQYINGNTSTSSTFAAAEALITNYASPSNKVLYWYGVSETNSASANSAFIDSSAGLWQSSSAITTLTLTGGVGDFLAGSSFYLYGVTRTNASSAPNAPTIGTASDGGDGTSASVAFTAPVSGSATDIYVATSSPGSFKGYGYYSPITVGGLTTGSSYTFTVAGINNAGTSASSAASNSVTIQVPPAFESIATATGTGSSATINFSSIPSTYKHLQLKILARATLATTVRNFTIRVNGDTGSNYTIHQVQSDGATSSTIGQLTSTTAIGQVGISAASMTAGIYGVYTIDILDYTSTSKNKTFMGLGGIRSDSSSNNLYVFSGLWMSTSAINQLDIITNGTAFDTSTKIALYGIKG